MTLRFSISSILSNILNIFVNLFPTLISFFRKNISYSRGNTNYLWPSDCTCQELIDRLQISWVFLQVQFQKYLSRQFSIAFDLYLVICEHVHQWVQHILQHDSPDWHLKHACPACTYKLQDEAPLLFSMLYTMDGNDSLKWIIWCSPSQDDNSSTPGPSSELPSSRKAPGDWYLPREYVDKWAKDVLQEMMGDAGDANLVNFM
jgi:hypothetical protein